MSNPPQTQPVSIVAIPADQVTKPSDFFVCKPFNSCKLLASACLVRQKDAATGSGVGANGTKFSKDYLKPCLTCPDGKRIAKVCGGKAAGSNATLDAATAALPNDPKAKARKPRKQESTLGQQQESRMRGARASARSKASRKSAERLDAATEDDEGPPEGLTFVRVAHTSVNPAPPKINVEQRVEALHEGTWTAPLNDETLNALLTGDTPPDAVAHPGSHVPSTTIELGPALPFPPDVDLTRMTTQQLADAINVKGTVHTHRAVALGEGGIGWEPKAPTPEPEVPISDRRTLPASFDVPPPLRPQLDTEALEAWLESTRVSLAGVEHRLEQRVRHFTLQILESIDRLRVALEVQRGPMTEAEALDEVFQRKLGANRNLIDKHIYGILSDRPMQFVELMEATGLSRDRLKAALARLKDAGLGKHIKTGSDTGWVRVEGT